MRRTMISNGAQLMSDINEIGSGSLKFSTRQFELLTEKVHSLLVCENGYIRPYDDKGMPGGIVLLNRTIETLILPDVHGRRELIITVLNFELDNGVTVLEKLEEGRIQILFVGDGMHGERRAYRRWQKALEEFNSGYSVHECMDEEMNESFGVMQMVFLLKLHYPEQIHYLKGNHDNILNEHGNGNYPFMKYAFEGPMVTEYVQKFYGKTFLHKYSRLEKNLPVFAIGKNFLVSHAEPLTFYSPLQLLNYRQYPELIEGLTWTDDNCSAPGTVEQMIDQYIRPEYKRYAYYFGGHRPVQKLYKMQSGGRYIQIHNPDRYIAAYIKPGKYINLNEDIIDLGSTAELAERKVVS